MLSLLLVSSAIEKFLERIVNLLNKPRHTNQILTDERQCGRAHLMKVR